MQIKNLKGEVLREVPGNSLRHADLRGADLSGADLREADLREADLREADLSRAGLRGADLRRAALCWANLRCANLRVADLRGADLREAGLYRADLRDANLREADLREADLRESDLSEADLRVATLSGAHLRGSDIRGAALPPPIVPFEGNFLGYKKVVQADGTYAVITLRIPADALRTSALSSRKCRASRVEVVEGRGVSPTCANKLTYTPGAVVTADSFNSDRREECTNGIHFFLTRDEAESYQT